MLMRFCYASTRSNHENLLEDLSEILSKSRSFNQSNGICGVLYYANNTFFQCLEGEKEVVEKLLTKIKDDSRHKDIILFESKVISEIHFKKWSMKYVEKNREIASFFEAYEYGTFQPHLLSEEDLSELVNILLSSQEDKKFQNHQGYKNRGHYGYL